MSTDRAPAQHLRVDLEEFERIQRLAMYEIGCAILDLSCDIQHTAGLRPDACQIYLMIAVSAVQRYARAPDGTHVGPHPLPREATGAISRRRVADATGLPRETVARHVRHLMASGLVIEVGRGQLTTPPGVLRNAGESGLPERMARRSAALANALLRLQVLKSAE